MRNNFISKLAIANCICVTLIFIIIYILDILYFRPQHSIDWTLIPFLIFIMLFVSFIIYSIIYYIFNIFPS